MCESNNRQGSPSKGSSFTDRMRWVNNVQSVTTNWNYTRASQQQHSSIVTRRNCLVEAAPVCISMNMSNLRVFLSTVNNTEFVCFPSCSQVSHLCLCYEENLLNFKEIVFRYTHGLGSLLNCHCPFFNFWLPDNTQSKRSNEWRINFSPTSTFKC